MTGRGWLEIAIYLLALLAVTQPLGAYMAAVFEGGGRRAGLWRRLPLWRLERAIYRVSGIAPDEEQGWAAYALSLVAFSAAGIAAVWLLQVGQGRLPWNPLHLGTPAAPAAATRISPDLALNTAVSFATNTNWQAYAGETTLSLFVQMAALTTQNFVSAAAGLALALAVVRGFARKQARTLGNFWADMTRAVLYVLLPLALLGALVLCSQGVIQNLRAPVRAATLEGAVQTLPQGPVASQEAIKLLGTNGGGFFNANSAHPYENPTPLANELELLMILAIPAALTHTFGRMVGDTRQGWALWAAMAAMFLVGVGVVYSAEQRGTPLEHRLGIATQAGPAQPGGNMEGKEVRFGIPGAALFATATTDASCGAVNAAHDSLTPLAGLVLLFNMQMGEVVFGGVGAGLAGILLFAILAVFIAGLMVGRTPEYLGKKIERREVTMAVLALVAAAAGILVLTALAAGLRFSPHGYWNPPGPVAANLANAGPHGFSELLYAYTSATANNGSAFAGLSVNTPWFNLSTALAMLVGRFLFLLPLLAAAGSLAGKRAVPATEATFPTHGGLFVALLVGTVVLVGALTFLPALALGPVAEHFLMHAGRLL